MSTKSVILSISFLTCITNSQILAQNVGINLTGSIANPSALLDIDTSPTNDMGMLIPRIALQATNSSAPVISPATSLLVYNTATNGVSPNNVVPGFYYWNGTSWISINGGNNSGDWSINGNANTTAASNFLGTINNQDLVFKTNNTEQVRINTSGNVGIGTSTPGFPLNFASVIGDKISLYGGAGNHYGLGINNSLLFIHTSSASSDIAFGYGSFASFTENMRVKGNGNVGIGTTAPGYRLQVLSNAIAPTVQIQNSNNGGYSGIHFDSDVGGIVGHIGYANTGTATFAGMVYAGSITAIPFALSTSDLERMRITPTGDVGIGTTAPNAKVEINSNSGTGFGNLRLTENQYDFSRISMYNIGSTRFWDIAAINDVTDSLSYFNVFNSVTGNLLTIRGNKNVGISNSNPYAPLTFENILGNKISLYGSSGSQYGLGIQSGLLQMYSSANTSDIVFGYGTSAAFTENVRMKGNGRVGILTNNPGSELEVNGYTMLGSNAPAIKTLKLTGITSATQGTSVSLALPISGIKILSIEVMVEYAANSFVPYAYKLNPGYEFYFFYNTTNLIIANMAANSANILSKPFKVFITYEF